MRALFEDVAYAAANSAVVIREVGLPQNSNRRDLWFKAFDSGATVTLCAFKSRAEAQAAVSGDLNYVASYVITPTGVEQTVTMTDNAATDPTMTGLAVKMVITGNPSASGNVWAYTACPDLAICENFVSLLRTYRGSGKALEAIDSDNSIMVADMAPSAFSLPAIRVFSRPGVSTLSYAVGSLIGREYPITTQVAVQSLGDPGIGWRNCRELQSAVESILADECRTGYGELLTVSWQGGDTPTEQSAGLWVASVNVSAVFHAVWRDDVYPRR